jgi:hypothetical protein
MKIYLQMEGDRLIELVERRELDAAQMENDRLMVLIARLHLAITARMSADDPTDAQRLELRLAWREAGAVLDQPAALPVTPNATDATIKDPTVMIERLANALALITEEYEDRRFQFGDEYLWQKHEGENPLPTAFAALDAYELSKRDQP